MRGKKQTPGGWTEGPHEPIYATEKKRRTSQLGLVHVRREIANLLGGISATELRELKCGDLAGRVVDRLCELGALNLYAAGVDYENSQNVRELEDRRNERLKLPRLDEGLYGPVANPYARPRK